MGVTLKELLELVKEYPLKLVAGEKGLTNQVSWVHMVGSPEIAEFLKGGEVAFTTGVGLRENMTLAMLVKTICEHHASAMVINIGPYIKEIPQDVIVYAQEQGFPLFEVPWEVHMADIMRIFSAKIQEREKQEIELSTLLRCALAAPEREELYVPGLVQAGFASDGDYTVCLLRCLHTAEARKRVLSRRFSNLLLQEDRDAVIFPQADTDLVLLTEPEKTAAETVRQIADKMGGMLQGTEKICISVGSGAGGLKEIAESYRLANLLLEFSLLSDEPQMVCTYENSGMAGLLFHIRDKSVLEHFYAQTIEPLAAYDRTHDSSLVPLLEAYFDYNGSTRKLAEIFYVHRNTIHYKLRKIEEILECDLGDYRTRTRLETGLLAGKIKDLI